MRMEYSKRHSTDTPANATTRQNSRFYRSGLTIRFVWVLLLFVPGHINLSEAGGIDEHDALLSLLIEHALPEDIEGKAVYVNEKPLAGGSEIKSWNFNYQVPEAFHSAWFFFIDDTPDANWQHSCRYVFIDTETKQTKTLQARTPPDNLKVLTKLYPQ